MHRQSSTPFRPRSARRVCRLRQGGVRFFRITLRPAQHAAHKIKISRCKLPAEAARRGTGAVRPPCGSGCKKGQPEIRGNAAVFPPKLTQRRSAPFAAHGERKRGVCIGLKPEFPLQPQPRRALCNKTAFFIEFLLKCRHFCPYFRRFLRLLHCFSPPFPRFFPKHPLFFPNRIL